MNLCEDIRLKLCVNEIDRDVVIGWPIRENLENFKG